VRIELPLLSSIILYHQIGLGLATGHLSISPCFKKPSSTIYGLLHGPDSSFFPYRFCPGVHQIAFGPDGFPKERTLMLQGFWGPALEETWAYSERPAVTEPSRATGRHGLAAGRPFRIRPGPFEGKLRKHGSTAPGIIEGRPSGRKCNLVKR
jgi:hypothetical protein